MTLLRSKKTMGRIFAACLLLGGPMAMASESKNSVFSLRYTCQVGEKPGVPRYSFELDGTTFVIQKTILLLNTRKLMAEGSLRLDDLRMLKEVLQPLLSNEFRARRAEKIEGRCSLHFSEGGHSVRFEAGENDPAWDDLRAVFDWFKELHKRYPGLSSIEPIFPGSPYKAAY
jgi:hypothetical protein